MSTSLNTRQFKENLLRFYLGKYEHKFKPLNNDGDVILLTDPSPILVITVSSFEMPIIILYEYIDIDDEDPYYGTFDHYCSEIIKITADDPEGARKMEAAVAKSLIVGTSI